jgi:hypothetical protein
MQELLEAPPWRSALILQKLRVPQLCHFVQMVRGHPDPLLRHGPVMAKIRFALVEEE